MEPATGRPAVTDRKVERHGPGFDRAGLLAARTRTWEAVDRIAGAVRVGMLEEDAYAAALAVLKGMGSDKNWHRPWIRFGSNTLKPYGVLSERGRRLAERDIFFIDIGPVWDGYEGDAGATFVTGDNEEMTRCRADAKRLFDAVQERWLKRGDSGKDLYGFADRTAKELGWRLNWRANGHRLSDFPHAIRHRGGLSDIGFEPGPDAWVLEIQIRHPNKAFGAFYENLLFR